MQLSHFKCQGTFAWLGRSTLSNQAEADGCHLDQHFLNVAIVVQMPNEMGIFVCFLVSRSAHLESAKPHSIASAMGAQSLSLPTFLFALSQRSTKIHPTG